MKTSKKEAINLAVISIGLCLIFIASSTPPLQLDLANAQQNKTLMHPQGIQN